MQNHGKKILYGASVILGVSKRALKVKGSETMWSACHYTVFHFPAVPARVVSFHYATHMTGTPVDSVEYDRLIEKLGLGQFSPALNDKANFMGPVRLLHT